MYRTLLVIVLALATATTQATSLQHHCSSDVYSPASGMADLKQNSTLRYCLIDNCTTMRIDTGQQLDIVYTTQSLLVVTPTDGQTSMIIPKNEPELFCSTINTDDRSNTQFARIIILVLLITVSSYIIAIHLIFKEMRSTFGKLMMFYNIGIACGNASVLALSIMHFSIAVYSTLPCYLLFLLFFQSAVVTEGFATCILAYLAYVMRQSYRSISVTKQLNKQFYKCSIRYVLGLLILLNVFIVSYDFGTGAYKYTLLPNGHCSFIIQTEYDTITINQVNNTLGKLLQGILLVVYFVYHYRINRKLKMIHSLASHTNKEQKRLFFRIAMMMGATIGISKFFFILNALVTSMQIVGVIGALSLLVQQCAIMVLYMRSRHMRKLCKIRPSSTGESP